MTKGPLPHWEKITDGLYAEPGEAGDILHVYAEEYCAKHGLEPTERNVAEVEALMLSSIGEMFPDVPVQEVHDT